MDEVVGQLGMKGGMQKEASMQFGSCGLPLTDEAVRQWEKAKNEESKDDESSSPSSSSSSSSDDEDETRTRTIKKVRDWDSDDYDDITSEDSESDKEVPVSKKRRIETKAGLSRKAKSDSVYGKVKVQAMNVLNLVMMTCLVNNIENIETPKNFINAALMDEQTANDGLRWTGPSSAYSKERNQWNDLGVTSYPDLIPVNQTDKNKPILYLM